MVQLNLPGADPKTKDYIIQELDENDEPVEEPEFRGFQYSPEPKLSEFVGLFSDVLTKEECQIIIDFFEENISRTTPGFTSGGMNEKAKESIDLQLLPTPGERAVSTGYTWAINPDRHIWILETLRQRLLNACGDYLENMLFNLRQDNPNHSMLPNNPINGAVHFTSFQIQKYPKGSVGYPAIHTENDSILFKNRLLAPIIYLNDIKEGGETEICLARMMVSPKAGGVLVIPTQPPWYHCGHPAPNEDKYIITSWLEFIPDQEVLARQGGLLQNGPPPKVKEEKNDT